MKKRRFYLDVPGLGRWYFYAEDYTQVNEIVDSMIFECEEDEKEVDVEAALEDQAYQDYKEAL